MSKEPFVLSPPQPPGPDQPRRGRYLYSYVRWWFCEDPVCDCSQVRVEHVYEHLLSWYLGARWTEEVWSGVFSARDCDDDRQATHRQQKREYYRAKAHLEREPWYKAPPNPR